jgi:hypothetical protein
MKRSLLILVGSTSLLAGCGQSSNNVSTNEAAANAAQPEKKPAYCFFKDDEMKDWKASRNSLGNIRIEGKAHVKDPRYKATVGQWAVGPKKVIIFPTITTNDTGYAKPDNWWDVGVGVPNTASLNEAVVQCGDKIVADIQVPPKS